MLNLGFRTVAKGAGTIEGWRWRDGGPQPDIIYGIVLVRSSYDIDPIYVTKPLLAGTRLPGPGAAISRLQRRALRQE